jgi:putative phosphoribosyl transferase
MARVETSRRWHDRRAAGLELSQKLIRLQAEWPCSNMMVVALPRGGVPVAYEVAQALDVPLTTWSVRKLTRNQAPEVAVGAIAAGDIEVWQDGSECIPTQERNQLLTKEFIELNRRKQCFGDAPIEQLRGKHLIVIDDGIATGMTVRAALRSLKMVGPSHLVLAVPVADPMAIKMLQGLCDKIITLKIDSYLRAVGEYYENFEQLDDEEVVALLHKAHHLLKTANQHKIG